MGGVNYLVNHLPTDLGILVPSDEFSSFFDYRKTSKTVSMYLPKVCDAVIKHVQTFIRMPQTQAERQAALCHVFRELLVRSSTP